MKKDRIIGILLTIGLIAFTAVFVSLIVNGIANLFETSKKQTSSTQLTSYTEQEKVMYTLTNNYRVEHGKDKLTMNVELFDSSDRKSSDICKTDKWSHNDSNGREFMGFIDDAGYNYETVGENLAEGYDTVNDAFSALVASPGHQKNILGDYDDIGISYNGCDGKNIFAVHYGKQ